MMQGQEWWEDFWGERQHTLPKVETRGDTWESLVWQVALDRWEKMIADLAPGRRVVECGCGSARVSRHMAARGYRCTLVDYSPHAIRLAIAGFHGQNLGGEYVLADLNRLPFGEGSFDVAYSGGVLEFFPDIHPPIQEMVRVLRQGGLFAANIIPRKVSIQTLGDMERTLAHGIRNLARGHLLQAFRRARAIPSTYDLNPARLRQYIASCEEAGLRDIVGLVTNPFPALALPASGARLYARIMRKLLPVWERFDNSRARWTEIWGTTYTLYGIKR